LHFKLLNAVGKAAAQLQLPADHELSAAKLYHDLFMSGLERIIGVCVVLRDAVYLLNVSDFL
jgi:hypothetical protein